MSPLPINSFFSAMTHVDPFLTSIISVGRLKHEKVMAGGVEGPFLGEKAREYKGTIPPISYQQMTTNERTNERFDDLIWVQVS
jgi:hypothetical protein